MMIALTVSVVFLVHTLVFISWSYWKLFKEYERERVRYVEAEVFMSNLRNLENKIMVAQSRPTSMREAELFHAIENDFGPDTVEKLIDEDWN